LGYLPSAIVNYVALLGWSPGNDQEFFTLETLKQVFNMDRINKSSAAFSFDKLLWLNGEHIRALSEEQFHQLALPFYPGSIAHLDLIKISRLIQLRVERLIDIPQQVEFLTKLPEYDCALYENPKSRSSLESSLQVLKGAYTLLEELQVWDNTSLFESLKTFGEQNGLKVGAVMWPIRTAISGLSRTPGGATELADIIGKPETLRRIKLGITKLETQ